MLAAGGGGGAGPGGSAGGQEGGDGGAGGTMTSTQYAVTGDFTTVTSDSSQIAAYLFAGSDGTYVKNAWTSSANKKQVQGRGATNTYGTNSEYGSGDETSHTQGLILAGGEGTYSGGGGGAGFHGGGGGAQNGSTGYNTGGGGGGNSLISATVKFSGLSSLVTGMLTSSATLDNGGAIKITWISKDLPS